MDLRNYFESLGREVDSLQQRVRHLLADRHLQTDGEWKESVDATYFGVIFLPQRWSDADLLAAGLNLGCQFAALGAWPCPFIIGV